MSPSLWRYHYPVVNGQLQDRERTARLSVWAAVHIETGEVEMTDLHAFDDDLTELCEGWEWRELLLTESTKDET